MLAERAATQGAMESPEGRAIVRRFTAELPGETTLERGMKDAQLERDAAEARIENFRAETARFALEKTCDDIAKTEEPLKSGKLSFGRRTAETKANEVVRDELPHGSGQLIDAFVDLKNYLSGLETVWRSKQKKPINRFRILCRSLDAHKNAFAVSPSQNNYASVLCGSRQLIVGAAVNHDEIVEVITETATNVSEKVSRVANTLVLFSPWEIRRLFSQLYAQVFLFYRDAINWYMKSRTSRFFASFNNDIKLTDIYCQTGSAHIAWNLVQHGEWERREIVYRQRQQSPERSDGRLAGQNMLALLQCIHQSMCLDGWTTRHAQMHRHRDTPNTVQSCSLRPSALDRRAAKDILITLEQFVVGDEGHSFLGNGKFWLPEVDIAARLHDWFGGDRGSATLWISSAHVTQCGFTSSRAAALNLLVAALQVETPILSHFCERPCFTTVASDRDIERVGLIGLVYSLMSQLLQFSFDSDTFEMQQEQVKGLDGSDESWPKALNLLSALLKTAPHLSLCAAQSEWCSAVLAMLFEHQKSSPGVFRILLTTSGQSRVLQDHIEVADRVFAMIGGREVIRGGQWMSAPDK
ncbi:hypothetical protein CC86DRAFT_447492 [Ophiobolus disseminans]|uniref:DUF7708 domain-containing protein n=1 Tax=Ophiobolus disseminans TaxID=1469910 RepID=A0A6A6ZRX4_9PLEO|nr:hypothetical protein CC86DRAFT_447492 [Ophiobolus disseminans]